MIKSILNLGKTPMSRRIFAALILLSVASGASILRNGGQVLTYDLALNVVVAAIAFSLLHLRWRKQERHALTPRKLRDTFS